MKNPSRYAFGVTSYHSSLPALLGKGRETVFGKDIAAAIVYAVTQPDRVNVNKTLIRPTEQQN